MRSGTFYPGLEAWDLPAKQGGMPVQVGGWFLKAARGDTRATLHHEIIRLAYDEYAAQGHGSQTLERLNERGGFGLGEIVMLLADALLRRGWVDKDAT